jgi:pimeloyl-ACP methyl ester carboxylesterase
VLRDHWFDVPLDHSKPEGETVTVYAREVVSAAKAANGSDRDLPWLLFLQGGPGGKSPRPEGGGWVGRACDDHRLLLLDQRGTGRSTPATATTLATRGNAAAQADYLAHFRADSIVADAEFIRQRLSADRRWNVLGQSYGGFCALTYLSRAPGGLAAVYITGGLGPLEAAADDVYELTFGVAEAKNAAFHSAFPAARGQLQAVADYLRTNDTSLPDGSPFTVERLQSLGIGLGQRSAYPRLAYLLEEAFVDGVDGRRLSDTFLSGAWSILSFAAAPLYAVMHEPSYGQGEPTRWAAQRVRDRLPQFSPDAASLLFAGEMVFPWMFDVDPALRPLRDTADLLANRSWLALYDRDVLAANEVPVAAALYTDDLYVSAELSRRTAAAVNGLRVWETNAFEHDGLRESAYVFDRLVKMARGEL